MRVSIYRTYVLRVIKYRSETRVPKTTELAQCCVCNSTVSDEIFPIDLRAVGLQNKLSRNYVFFRVENKYGDISDK